MISGKDLLENVRLLVGLVDHIEIVLFHTSSRHNIPGLQEIHMLKEIGKQQDVTFTVHLPPSLEIASSEKTRREESVQFARELCLKMAEFDPMHYILHVPFSSPTLVAIPSLYFTTGEKQEWDGWTKRALGSLEMLYEALGDKNKLLVENINYSPSFLEPILKKGLCGFCLDLGHLMLGRENVMESIEQYLDVTEAIHLHGVKGYEEHLSLSKLPKNRVKEWLRYLIRTSFRGVITLEVFSPRDLEESMDVLFETFHLEIRE
jgi:sugar phosphate isomerase/epimerase